MSRFEQLVDGDKVYLEEIYYYPRESSISEYIVVKHNKTSAYVTPIKKEQEYREGSYSFSVRINQKDRVARSLACSYIVWSSEEEYNKAKGRAKEKHELLKAAQEKINKMSLEELRLFMKE